MPLFNWPYTNLHNLNLDWIIKKIKNVETAETNTAASEEAAAGSAASAAESEANAAESETNAAASATAAGNYYNQIRENVSTLVTGWMDEHITPTTPPVDDTLTIHGAAADAKKTGDEITDVKNAIQQIEDMEAENVSVISLSDFLPGAVTDDETFRNPGQTSSNQFKYIKFTDFLVDKTPYVNIDVGSNHLLAFIGLFDANNTRVWSTNSWVELTSGNFNYVKKSVVEEYNAKTLAITVIVSTNTTASGRIDIPSDTVFDVYYYHNSVLLQTIKDIENGTGNFVIVGGNSDYQTIQSAIGATQDGDTIIIMPGTYNEAVEMWGKERHLVGVERDACVIYSGNGLYDTPALEANIGSVRNLTIISGNDNNLTEDSAVAKAYGIHIEYANAEEYSLNIENCVIKSALHSAIGMGVRYNQHVNIVNCYVETEANQTYSYATLSFINAAPILFHNDSLGSDKGGNGSLHISKCELVGKSCVVMARSMDNGNNLSVRFDRNLGYYTNTDGAVVNYWGSEPPIDSNHFVGSDVIFDKNSFGNNKTALNYTE